MLLIYSIFTVCYRRCELLPAMLAYWVDVRLALNISELIILVFKSSLCHFLVVSPYTKLLMLFTLTVPSIKYVFQWLEVDLALARTVLFPYPLEHYISGFAVHIGSYLWFDVGKLHHNMRTKHRDEIFGPSIREACIVFHLLANSLVYFTLTDWHLLNEDQQFLTARVALILMLLLECNHS